MASVKTALIIGGGIAGLSAAIALLRNGVAVDIVEKDKDWTVYGAGISLTGPTLRAFSQIGVLDQIKTIGFCHSGLILRDGVTGEILKKIEMAAALGDGVPGGGGIMRPALQKILVDAVAEGGGKVRLGVTLASYDEDALGVDVKFTDGTNGRYDVVVGADGIASSMRSMLFPDSPSPVYSGQAVWRATAPRSPEIDCSNLFLLGNLKVGANPASEELMYFFLTVNAPGNPRVEPGSHHILLRELMAGFGGPVKRMRETLSEATPTLYRPFESIFMAAPWYRGRVILIGDAVHAATPHLASGAGIAIEDAVVLAEVLNSAATVPDAFASFMDRRFERCKMVVESSLKICAMEQSGKAEETTAMVGEAMHRLGAPI